MENGKVIIQDDDGIAHMLDIFGNHNLQNLRAAQLATECIGLASKDFYPAIRTFSGASKRLQVLVEREGLTAYLDFAHAPSKVGATVNAVREKHQNAFIIGCLELHTFSSLNPAFLPQYKDTMKDADVKILYYSPHTLAIKKLPDLSPEQLTEYFNEPTLQIATTVEALAELIHSQRSEGDTVLLWMSSGRFDGLDLAAVSLEIGLARK